MDFLLAVVEYRAEAQKLAIVITVAAALRWGAGPERACGVALLYLLLADVTYHAVLGPGVELLRIDVGHAVIDSTAALVMIVVALASNRMYTLWIGALQIIAVQAHIARDLEAGISPLAYSIMYVAPSYLQIGLLAGGIWAHRRRLRRFGTYRSWRTSLAPWWAKRPLAWQGG